MVFFLAFGGLVGCGRVAGDVSQNVPREKQIIQQRFLEEGLMTNTTKRSIDLLDVLEGGPGKDGIPSINRPRFVAVNQAKEWLTDTSRGLLVRIGDVVRFYPYDILYWHEIVNDQIGDHAFVVTFCPLCGTGIVYDRSVAGEVLTFGVSGKLWQSNLLMYDDKTESLWSQIEGEAMVGDFLGTSLGLVSSDLVFWKDIKAVYPQMEVLSRRTGYHRSYGESPYGSYETNDALMFSVDHLDVSFRPKELFIAGMYRGASFALHRSDLLHKGEITFTLSEESLVAKVSKDRTIKVSRLSGEIIPHFVTMWFSWANHHKGDQSFVWSETP